MIKEKIQGKNAKEKAEIKANALANVVPVPFISNGISITITDLRAAGEFLQCYVIAERDGANVLPQNANPFLFKNPPIMVPDGTKRSTVGPDGEQIELNNHREDLWEALKQMVGEAVRIAIKHG